MGEERGLVSPEEIDTIYPISSMWDTVSSLGTDPPPQVSPVQYDTIYPVSYM